MLQLIIVADVIKVCLVINLLLGEDCACWKVGTEIQMQYQLIDFAEQNGPQLLLLDWELAQECSMVQKLQILDLATQVK